MNTEDIRYRITFRPGTFRWRPGKAVLNGSVHDEVQEWLVMDPDGAYPHVETTITPLKLDSALFLNLAAMDLDAGSFQRFCHEYGPLIDQSYFLPPTWSGQLPPAKKGSSGLPSSARRGCSLKTLVSAARKLRRAVLAWQNSDSTSIVAILRSGWRRSGWRGVKVLTDTEPLDEPPGLRIVLRPQTLMDGLWLQLLFAVTHSKEFRQCEICSKWFEVMPPVTRTTRMYCGGTCRTKATRQRMAKVVELFVAGRTISQIRKEIGTDKETIEKWVRQSQKNQ